MIQVIKSSNSVFENITFDKYIPFNIEFGKWDISLEPTIYWRIGNFSTTLLEFGIGSLKGDIRSVTLTLANIVNEIEESYSIDGSITTYGIPVVRIQGKQKLINTDEKNNFKSLINGNRLKIIFSPNMITSIIKNDRVSFGIDKNSILCRIEIENISSSEINDLLISNVKN